MSKYEAENSKSEDEMVIILNKFEINIINQCFKEVSKEIEEWEFSTRIGISTAEAKAIKSKLTG